MADLPDEIRQRFPDLTPVRGAPTLFSINGFGLILYGGRDRDRETSTLVKTRCLCVLFVPVLAIDSFRVGAARGGWIVVGKQPLSAFAKGWNLLLVVAIAAIVAVAQYQAWASSPEHLAAVQLARAQRADAEGRLGDAIKDYAGAARSHTPSSVEAERALAHVVSDELAKAPFPDAAVAAHQLSAMGDLAHEPSFTTVALADRCAALAEAHTVDQPKLALSLIDDAVALQPKRDVAALREHVLEGLCAKEPEAPEWASRLAELCDARGDAERCEKLLTPHAQRLGSLEGARILGRIYSAKGRWEDSYRLLSGYCAQRLKELQAADDAYRKAFARAAEASITALNQGAAGDAWYAAYKAKSKSEQERAVEDWQMARVKQDPGVASAQKQLAAKAAIVPVAFDLGIVTLQRAQGQGDPEARRAGLADAEKTFLAIRGLAGESDEFRLYYGEVLYWLGKPAEGRKQFDDLLAARSRGDEALLGVAGALRQVGADADARALAEEAWRTAKSDEKRQSAAGLRSLLFTDAADQVAWLERCDQHQAEVAAHLAWARGEVAQGAGQEDEALRQFRSALEQYSAMPKAGPSLNNGALAALAIFGLTSERAMLERGNGMMEEAIALMPSDTVLQSNLSSQLIQAGVMEVVGDHLDLPALRLGGDLGALDQLYRDEAGRADCARRVAENPSIVRALAMTDRLIVLAPQGALAYTHRLWLLNRLRDAAALGALRDKLAGTDVDLAVERARLAETIAGKDRERRRGAVAALAKRYETLLAQPGFAERGATYATAACELVDCRVAQWSLGQTVDTDAAVALADAAHAAAPSAATYRALIDALLLRAADRAAKADAAFATLAERRSLLTPRYLVPVALAGDGGSALAADADVRRAGTVAVERMRAIPCAAHVVDWALLAPLDADAAAACARLIAGDQVAGLCYDIEARLSRYSPTVALEDYWRHRMSGDADGARAALEAARSREVPLPALP